MGRAFDLIRESEEEKKKKKGTQVSVTSSSSKPKSAFELLGVKTSTKAAVKKVEPQKTTVVKKTVTKAQPNLLDKAFEAVKKGTKSALDLISKPRQEGIISPVAQQDQVTKPGAVTPLDKVRNVKVKPNVGGSLSLDENVSGSSATFSNPTAPVAVVNAVDALRKQANLGLTTLSKGVVPNKDQVMPRSEYYSDEEYNKAVKKFENRSLSDAVNKDFGLGITGIIQSATGGILKATPKASNQANTIDEKIVSGVGNVVGSVYTLKKIAGVFNKIASGSGTVGAFLDKFPKISKYVIPYASNILAFDVYGQLDPDQKDRFLKLAEDTATGALFSTIGGVKSGALSIPLNFATGFALAKSQGATNQDAFISGGILSVLDASGRASRSLVASKFKSGSLKMTPEQLINQAESTNFRGTEASDVLKRAAREAQIQGKDVEISLEVARKSKLAKAFNAKTPEGAAFSIKLVDKNPIVLLKEEGGAPGKTSPPGPPKQPGTPPETLPDVIKQEFNKRPVIVVPKDFRSETERKSFEQIEQNQDELVDQYVKENINEVDPDKIRQLFTEYKGYNVAEFNRPVGKMKDRIYTELLDNNQGQGNNTVLITAGGSGSGKTTGLVFGGTTKSEFPVILDSTFSYSGAADDVKEALNKGYNVEISYTVRDPLTSWVKGALPRVKEEGRIVSEGYFLQTHRKAKEIALKLYEKYQDDPKVEIGFIDNTGESMQLGSVETLKDLTYNEVQVAKEIADATEKAYEQGQLTKEQYEAIKADRNENVTPRPQKGSPETPRKEEVATTQDKPQKKKVLPSSKKKEIVTDSVRVQQIKNSIADGEGLLNANIDVLGKTLTPEKRGGILRSVNSDRAKIGLKPYLESKKKSGSNTQPKVSKKPSFNSREARTMQEAFRQRIYSAQITATSQEELIKIVEPIIDKAIKNSSKTELAGIRTAINKEMFSFAGLNNSHKQDYAVLRTMIDENEPSIGEYLGMLEDKLNTIDEKLFENNEAPSGAFFIKRESDTTGTVDNIKPAKSPEELIEKIDQLNKFAQANAILRRTGGITKKKAVGQFVRQGKGKLTKQIAKEGQVRLRGKYIANESDYVGVLAHELGHAIEFHVTGSVGKNTYKVFGDKLDDETVKNIEKELKAITLELEGSEAIAKNPKYYNKPEELLARFFEKLIVSPGNLTEIAPTAIDLLEKQAILHPMVAEFLQAAQNNIDKGAPKFAFLRDLKQTYQKHLGKRVGNIAYGEELAHRAMQERGKLVLKSFIDKKFKDIKDDPALLFRVAESIKITRGGVPEFGTRDFALAKSEKEKTELESTGWEQIDTQLEDGVAYPLFARQRYTQEEGQAIYDELSPKGKKLINDFTAERSEAKDYFNREVIKDINKIESNIEGWVHHYFEDSLSTTISKKLKFRERRAGAKQKRKGKEGYVEDFKKAMTRAMIDLESEKVFNDFITRQFSRVSKPIPEGKGPDKGWVEVVGNLKKGVGLPQEKKVVIIKDGKRFVAKQTRYQIPREIYERYKMWQGLIDEASLAVKIVADINRYWRINVLTHAGTAGTNFIGGGIQYSSKILTDFYTETLTGKIAYKQTKKNVSALLKVLFPKGWYDSPDWIYGADLSNYYGEFTDQPTLSKGIAKYGNATLKLFSTYERYWKKVISLSEGARDLKQLENMSLEGLRLPTAEERQKIIDINQQVDLYGYDYDNVPVWLEQHQRSVFGQLIKPFAKYPYKYAKHITGMAGAVFDRTIPWQERLAKLLALTTLVALYAAYSAERKKKQQTPEGTENTPARLSTRGRLFAGVTDEGKEKFIRVAKYPFINLSEFGTQLVNGEWEAGKDILSDMKGSLGPVADMLLLAFDYRSKYNQFESVPVLLGDSLSTFVPGFRLLDDISRSLDPFQRKQDNFVQTFTKLIPTTSEDLQNKLHGSPRTVRIPIEGEIETPEGSKRTTIDVTLKNYWEDILLGALTGIYTTRIDPKEAKAFLLREEENNKKAQVQTFIDEAAENYLQENNKSILRRREYERQIVKNLLGDEPYSKEEKKQRDSIITKFRNKVK